ncbi:SRPBCC domain-containing protein [Clostridium sp. DJ247]|uniref:SRPBCC domain-containing protein n=1 Tax=Clostridium sp. DJ247 TaxID=2726188 RepID=UPI001623236A|nr:SRPBCC domain-containing protein [Clostridium sp. DJ247]MBC2581438.1 hypothetical protein [Clostridium sp. DJ247]
MAYAEKTVFIERQVTEVFQFVLDGENNKLWRPTVKDIKRMEDKPVGVGTVFIQGMNGPNGMRINADYEIIECDMDKKIVFKVLNGPSLPIGTFSFETQDKGTKVTFSMNEASVIDPARDHHLQKVVDALTGLKEYLESRE